MSDTDERAEVLALRLALEVAWVALLQNSKGAAETADRLKRESVATLRAITDKQPQAHDIVEATVMHTENLWQSIAERLQPPAAQS